MNYHSDQMHSLYDSDGLWHLNIFLKNISKLFILHCGFKMKNNIILYFTSFCCCLLTHNINAFTLGTAKKGRIIWKHFSNENVSRKIFQGEMLTRSQITTLLQIFSERLFYSSVIFNNMKVADDTF